MLILKGAVLLFQSRFYNISNGICLVQIPIAYEIIGVRYKNHLYQLSNSFVSSMSKPNEQASPVDINYKEIDILEKQFQEILNNLVDDYSLQKFKAEYEKLYRALKRSHDNEKILYNRITQLSRDMTNQMARIRVALKLSQEDAQAITFLKQELERTFRILELSRERQQRSKQKIEAMNCKIKVLQLNLQQRQALSAGQSNTLNELKQKKDDLLKQKQQLNDVLSKLKFDLSDGYEKLRISENERADLQLSIRTVSKQVAEINEKLMKDEGRKIKIQLQLDNLQKEKNATESQTLKYVDEQEKLRKDISMKEADIESKKNQQERLRQQNLQKQERIHRLKEKYQDLTVQKSQLHNRFSSLQKTIQLEKKQLNVTIASNGQMQKNVDKIRSQAVMMDDSLSRLQKQNEVLLNSVTQIERQIIDRRKLTHQDESELIQLQKSKNALQKQLLRLESECKFQNQKITRGEKQVNGLQLKIVQTNDTIEKLKRQAQVLEKDKERYGNQAAIANSKYLQSLEEIKLKGNMISEYQKKNLQTESRLKQQQKLYEAVRSDRNMYSKNLSETQDEIAQIKRRYKIVNHQINQLKEQIDAKEVALAREHFEHKKKDKTIEQHSKRLQKFKKDIQEKQQKIKNFHGQISKLDYIIRESNDQLQKKNGEYEQIVAERDILGTQLIRRNDESALLSEKIKIQQSTLAKGQTAYRDRLADLKLLDYKEGDLKRQLRLVMKQASKIQTYKNQIYMLNNQLIEQKLKKKALEQQLQNPLNAQRIRPLQGTDPDIHEMKEKAKTLQKRLIGKTQSLVEKDVILHQKQKQIQEFRQIMKRQPGRIQVQKISSLTRTLQSKTRKMKALAAEINYCQAKSNQNKIEFQRMSKDISELERQYNQQKRREQLAKQSDKIF